MDARTRRLIQKLCARVGVETPIAAFRIIGDPLRLVVNDEADVVSETWRHVSEYHPQVFLPGLYIVYKASWGRGMVGTRYLNSDTYFTEDEIENLHESKYLKRLRLR